MKLDCQGRPFRLDRWPDTLLLLSILAIVSQRAQAQQIISGVTLVDAVQRTLDRHPLLKVQQRQVDIRRALLRQATSQFDQTVGWTFSQSRLSTPLTLLQQSQASDAGYFTSAQAQNLTSSVVSSQKLFRSGIEISPSWELDRTTDNLTSATGLNQSRLAVQVVLPLARNRGRDVVAAREASASIEVDASVYDVSQTTAELIVNTTIAYWTYVAASKGLEVLKGSEARGNSILDNVRILVDADRLPRSEFNVTSANLAERVTNRIAGEQQVLEARQALGVAMGLTASEMESIPPPDDQLPDASKLPSPSLNPASIQRYIQEALARRADYLAAIRRKESVQKLEVAASNQLLPRWDVVMSAGYAGLQEGVRPDRYLVAPFTRVPGPDVTGGIRYSFPLKNNFAQGQLEQVRAGVDQADLRAADLSRTIASGVIVSANAVGNSILRAQNARHTVVGFETALQAERDKLRLGIGSLIDTLTVEDRLTVALGSEVEALLAYVNSVIRFRFATGTIMVPGRVAQSVDRQILVTPPFDENSTPGSGS